MYATDVGVFLRAANTTIANTVLIAQSVPCPIKIPPSRESIRSDCCQPTGCQPTRVISSARDL